MTAVFLYGTLLHPPLFGVVAGVALRGGEDAVLPDHAVFWAPRAAFALICPEPGARAAGRVLTGLSPEVLARLDFYHEGLGCRRTPVHVECIGGPVEAMAYVGAPERHQPGAPWSLEHWQRQWGEITPRAAADLMACFGTDGQDDAVRFWPQIMVRASSHHRARTTRPPRPDRQVPDVHAVLAKTRAVPYQKFFQLEEQEISFPRFDGSQSPPVHRAAFVPGDAVTVLPYDPARDRVLLIEQFRFGPYVRGDRNPWSLEPVAGRIDPGEAPEDCARREAQEEARLALGALEFIGNYYPSPGAITEYLFSYIGIADLPDGCATLGGVEDEAEDIRGLLLSFDGLMDLLHTGAAQNGPLILSALWLAGNREQLRCGA